tara:strand:+ start:5905 stop:6351 length:447 start_codon:yes stop_codon:yes gene_type:complete
MSYKDLNRNRKVYSFIRRKPAHALVVEDVNAEDGDAYEIVEDFSFASGDVSNASGSGFVTFTTNHALDAEMQSMPYVLIQSMDTIDSSTFPYVREVTRAVGSDKLTIDVYFKTQLANPSNTYKISQSSLQTKLASNTINIKIKLLYIV